jgi:hypothetical protein
MKRPSLLRTASSGRLSCHQSCLIMKREMAAWDGSRSLHQKSSHFYESPEWVTLPATGHRPPATGHAPTHNWGGTSIILLLFVCRLSSFPHVCPCCYASLQNRRLKMEVCMHFHVIARSLESLESFDWWTNSRNPEIYRTDHRNQ